MHDQMCALSAIIAVETALSNSQTECLYEDVRRGWRRRHGGQSISAFPAECDRGPCESGDDESCGGGVGRVDISRLS